MSIMKRGLYYLILAAMGASLAACEHTIRGAGQDIQETGEAVEDAIEG
jgi:predicted small secreted protein